MFHNGAQLVLETGPENMPILSYEAVNTILLLVAVLAFFDAARHYAVFGRSARVSITLFIAFCIATASAIYAGAQGVGPRDRPSPNIVLKPRLAESSDPAAIVLANERSGKAAAQQAYLNRGERLAYTLASGASVTYAPTPEEMTTRAGRAIAEAEQAAEARGYRVSAWLWLLAWAPALLAGYLLGRREFHALGLSGTASLAKPQTYAEVEGLVGVLKAACEDPQINATLEVLLSQSDAKRKSMLRELVERLRNRRAPAFLTDAFVCLMDDEVAEKVYVFIHKCERPMPMT